MPQDLRIYESRTSSVLETGEEPSWYTQTMGLAKRWIRDADAILIVAGAGMSLKDNEKVYTSEDDFVRHYPWMPQWGYTTA